MYALKNKVQLIGNLGNAPEVRNTENGKKFVRFSLATNEVNRNANGEKVTELKYAWKESSLAGFIPIKKATKNTLPKFRLMNC